MGSWDGCWVVPGIALPAHRSSHTPGTPPPTTVTAVHGPGMQSPELNMPVGLISVRQLSLYALFSGFQGFTEGYNLAVAGNPNDQNVIPGTD